MTINGEVIAIGDELTSGVRLDTNSQWLSERLGELGIRVLYHTTVGDDIDANIRVFREAMCRADVIVCTGGLGPTADDLTREALAAATDRPLTQNDEALAHIQALFASRQRPMPERNVKQALFPVGSHVISNPHGTAPGIDLSIERQDREPARFFALPGVPAEMREMWQQTVAPELARAAGDERRMIRHRRIKCFGVGESDLEQMLPDLIRRGRWPSVGITVSQATITLRVTADGEDETACFAAMEPTLEVIREQLGDIVFGNEDDELQHAVMRMLAAHGQTLAVVEMGTGGLICDWLSGLDTEGRTFVGGSVVRNGNALRQTWGLELESEEGTGESALRAHAELARVARGRFAVDFCLVVGQFPHGAESGSEPPYVACALADGKTEHTKRVKYAGHPDILKSRTAKTALDLLRQQLLVASPGGAPGGG